MNLDLRRHADLIAALDELFPLKNPPLDMPLEAIRYSSGQRSVVEYLQRELQSQEQSMDVLGTPNDV